MYRHKFLTSFVLSAGMAAVISSSACGRSEEPRSVSEAQSQTSQPANQPMTVAGCLRAGDAADTFVLNASGAEGSQEAATYHLVGAQGVSLSDHVGKRVEVSGMVDAHQAIASRTTALPSTDDRPTGTTGTPVVETKTEIDIKRVSVNAVKPLGDTCDM